jgi:formamidopyrimidine-DNA glycosylase
MAVTQEKSKPHDEPRPLTIRPNRRIEVLQSFSRSRSQRQASPENFRNSCSTSGERKLNFFRAVPELPDITIYLEALKERILDQPLQHIRIASPFLLRTAVPSIDVAQRKRVVKLRRVGKRVAIGLEAELWLVLHLMIAGRLHWKEPGAKLARKLGLAAFDFPNGTLLLTEAGSKKRASLHLVEGEEALSRLDPGGLEVMDAAYDAFATVLTSRNHTLKRALTDPSLFSGIGNSYSDEILHHAGLSPVALTQKLNPEQIRRLYESVQGVLREWIVRLREEKGTAFPEHVTAFRREMAVHGRFGQPCPVCGSIVQRIRYAENETNYCPTCQTGGKLLADRSLSLLLKKDWPKTPEALEQFRAVRRG